LKELATRLQPVLRQQSELAASTSSELAVVGPDASLYAGQLVGLENYVSGLDHSILDLLDRLAV
jgi:hypothetical protein